MKQSCYCVICSKFIGEFYLNQIRKTCSKVCKNALNSINVSGISNPNYRHGRYIINNCKICNKVIDGRSIYCSKCKPNGFKGKQHTVRAKRIIGNKSKDKFTADYIEKNYKSKRRGKKKRSSNGYTLIKNYIHPNRTVHNDILEHILVMSAKLKRPLTKKEIIHHKDFDKINNKISNLHLYASRSEHSKIHKKVYALVGLFYKAGLIKFTQGKYSISQKGKKVLNNV